MQGEGATGIRVKVRSQAWDVSSFSSEASSHAIHTRRFLHCSSCLRNKKHMSVANALKQFQIPSGCIPGDVRRDHLMQSEECEGNSLRLDLRCKSDPPIMVSCLYSIFIYRSAKFILCAPLHVNNDTSVNIERRLRGNLRGLSQ